MSTKTLLKRLALGTVVALGASVLTVSSANAAASAIAYGSNGTNGSSVGTDGTNGVSAGLLGSVSGSGLTATATVLSNGALAVNYANADNSKTVTLVTGGTISASLLADNISADRTLAGANNAYTVVVSPNAGVTQMVIQTYDAVAATTATTSGTLSGQIVVTVATTSVSGAFSATKSLINTAVSGNSTNAGVDVVNTHSNSTSTIPNGELAQVNFTLNDAYGVALPAGAVIATATGGGYVKLSSGTSAGTATATTDVQTASSGSFTVKQAVANAPADVTVTVSYNGTVVTTRTFNFRGEVAKVVASNPRVVSTSEPTPTKSSNASFTVRYYDSAGNELWPADASTNTTVVSGTAGGAIPSGNISIVSGSNGNAGGTRATDANAGVFDYIAGKAVGSVLGSTSIQLQYLNGSGTIVKSNAWTQNVAGDAYSYTATLDKATYTTGSVATLTITFKDSKGNLANHLASKITDANDTITIAGAPGTVVTAPASTDVAGGGTDAAGTKTYQFTVTQAEGSYQAIVNAPLVDSPVTVAYTVANGSTSLNDVLKGIVSLIASINKQIAALAKLVAPAKKK